MFGTTNTLIALDYEFDQHAFLRQGINGFGRNAGALPGIISAAQSLSNRTAPGSLQQGYRQALCTLARSNDVVKTRGMTPYRSFSIGIQTVGDSDSAPVEDDSDSCRVKPSGSSSHGDFQAKLYRERGLPDY